MRKVHILFATLSAFTLLNLAGCPSSSSVVGATDAVGTWSATLNCETTESVGGVTGPTTTSSKTVIVTFDATGFPTGLKIDGFSGDPDQTVVLAKTGDTVTVNYSANSRTVTMTATVASATYTRGSANIQLDLTYHATQGASTYDGTGTAQYVITLTSDGLSWTSDVNWDITLSIAGTTISFPTTQTVHCEGTLSAQ